MDIFVNALEGYPIQSGLILIGLGVIALLFRLEKKNSFRMQDYSISEWRVLLSTWVLIFIMFMTGVVLILKNI